MKIKVIGHANCRRPKIEEDLLGYIHVYVSEPPLKGKANRAIVEALAKYFGVRKSDILQVSGQNIKNKLFEINTDKRPSFENDESE